MALSGGYKVGRSGKTPCSYEAAHLSDWPNGLSQEDHITHFKDKTKELVGGEQPLKSKIHIPDQCKIPYS